MFSRQISDVILKQLRQFPIVTLTGCRQCGKSTLLKNLLPDYKYVSLEDPDIREMADKDPRHFLSIYDNQTVIDEVQRVPELLSYLQTHIDKINRPGMYVLSGLQNFQLSESISQSLAGRTAVLSLAPFSIQELRNSEILPGNLNEMIFTGGYPRIFDFRIPPEDYFPSYINTYLERDVRNIKDIKNLSTFNRFLKICAARCGQLWDATEIADDLGINRKTVIEWLSVLEASYIVFMLKPYYKNYGKRIVKSPKLYFYDTGLACALLGIDQAGQLDSHYMRGALFENLMISEYAKKLHFAGKPLELYFWRDSNGLEVDLIAEENLVLHAWEIKSSLTMNHRFYNNLVKFCAASETDPENTAVVYGGNESYPASETKGAYVSWKDF